MTTTYRIYCITEGECVYVTSDTKPTVCPTNVSHSIDSDSIVIIKRINDYVSERVKIMGDIFLAFTSPEQANRLIAAIDLYPSFMVALDSGNYVLARGRMSLALDAEVIIQDDYDLVDGILPSN